MMFIKTIALVGLTGLLWTSQAGTLKSEAIDKTPLIPTNTTQTTWDCPNDCNQNHDPENCPYGDSMVQNNSYRQNQQQTRQHMRQGSGNCHRNSNN